MDSDFYTTLSSHKSIKAKRILKEYDDQKKEKDKLFHLLFGSRDSNLDPKWNPNLDDILYLYIESGCHENIINILKMGIVRQSVYGGLKHRFMLPICEDAEGWKKSTSAWMKKSEKEKHILIVELINRFYSDTYGYKQHIKPLTHRVRVIQKIKRKQKNRKDRRVGHAIKDTLLINPYFKHPIQNSIKPI